MIRFLGVRALWLAATVWVVMTVAFLLMRAVPGGPFSAERRLPAEVQRNIEERYHLDWPIWRQYLQYVGPLNLDRHGLFGDRERIFGGVLTGDFGPSFRYRDFSVNDVIAQSLPITLILGLGALAWAIVVGLAAGMLAALYKRSALDLAVRVIAALGVALPNFVLAGILIVVFCFNLDLLPAAGTGELAHLVLPSIALGTPFAAYVAKLSRAGLLEALSQDWILTARAKGLAPTRVLLRHALRSGVLPVVSFLGPASAGILTGSLVIERIFAIPGLGTHFVTSALNRDYTLALGVTILYSVLVFSLNTLVDIAYTRIDPRIALEEL